MAMYRSRVTWGGSAIVGPGISTFFFDSTSTPANISPALNTFFNAVKTYFPSGVTWTIPNGGDTIGEDGGELEGIWTSGGSYTVTGGGAGLSYAAGVGARINWGTSVIHNRRRVRGSTFLCPIGSDYYSNDGTLNNSMVTAIDAAANAFITTAGITPVVWSRQKPKTAFNGIKSPIETADCPDKVSWLRSRRL